jgi:hypothetical protein
MVSVVRAPHTGQVKVDRSCKASSRRGKHNDYVTPDISGGFGLLRGGVVEADAPAGERAL